MVIINDDYESAVNKEKGVSDVSSAVNDSDSKIPEVSQTLNAAGIKEGIDEDPKVVKSSSKKKKKNKNSRRKDQCEVPLKNTYKCGSSSQNSGKFPQFNLNDYPLAREEDRNMMKMINEFNRRNHAIITKQGFDGVSDGRTVWEPR